MTQFPPQFFIKNRAKLLGVTKAELIVVVGNGQLQRNGDNTYPFRQDSSFWYLTGLELPSVIWVADTKKGDEWVILPERSETENIFDGQVLPRDITSVSGVKTVLTHDIGWKRLAARLKKAKTVATLHPAPSYIDNISLYTNPSRAVLMKQLREHGRRAVADIREPLALLRQIKQPLEIEALQEAIDITSETLEEIRANLTSYKFEYQVEAELSAGYRKRGAQGHAFAPIVASGKNACTLHYHTNQAALAPGSLALLDTGAEVNNYAADITRTYPVGNVSQRQIEVYDAVYQAQKAGFAAIKPGVTFKEVDALVNDHLEDSMRRLHLKPIGDKSLLRSYYPHAWHWLGLDVHDVGDYLRTFEPGMVLTVEPGIYIASEAIGVRLEDDVLVTKDGCKVLSAKLPSKPQSIFTS